MSEDSLIPAASRTTLAQRSLLVALGLIGVLIVGAYLRLVGIDWDENEHLHPDERFLTQVEVAIEPVTSLQAYFDTPTSTLNPNNVGHGFFVYGDFPIILVRYVGQELEKTLYSDIYLVGRALSAGFDLLTIVLLFLLGRRLYDVRIGLLAAALYALATLPIQQSHFFTVDTFTNTFVVAAFLFAARSLDEHRWPDYFLFGLMLGLATASKISVVPLAVILILAIALRVLPQLPLGERASSAWQDRATRKKIIGAALGLMLGGLVTIVVFRVAMPYAFLPPGGNDVAASAINRILQSIGLRLNPLWLDQMREVRHLVSGNADIPPNHQWANRLPLVFPWLNMVRFGMGWPLGLTAWLAFVWAIWEIVRGYRHWKQHLLLVAWIALFFGWQGSGWVMSMRYFLPLYPFLALLAAWALITIGDRARQLLVERGLPPRHWAAGLSTGFLLAILVMTGLWGFAFSRIYTRPVTRVAASDWIYENIPSDITLTIADRGRNALFSGRPATELDSS